MLKLKLKLKKLLKILTRLLFIYALLGFVAVPIAGHIALALLAPKILTEPVNVGAISFNPFTLKLSLQSVKISGKQSSTSADIPVFAFQRLDIDLSWDSLSQRALVLDHIQLDDPVADIRLFSDAGSSRAQLNLAKLLVPSKTPSQPSTSESSTHTSSKQPPVHVFLHTLKIKNAQVSFQDTSKTMATESVFLYTSAMNIDASNLAFPDYNGTVSIDARISSQPGNPSESTVIHSQIQLSGQTTPDVSFLGQVSNFSLPVIQPYVTPYSYLELTDGLFSGKVNGSWGLQSGLKLNGTLELAQLNLIDVRGDAPVASWEKLIVAGLIYDQNSNRLSIEQIHLQDPMATVTIDEQLEVNLAKLVKPAPNTSQASDNTEPETKADTHPFQLRIGTLQIANGSLAFADHSFKPGFSAPISKLEGSLNNFDLSANTLSEFKLIGQVDQYSPVSITASLQPNAPLDNTSVELSFTDVGLTTLTPYAGRFAGYNIRKGRMDLDLKYQLKAHQLSAKNYILLKHLELGKEVPGDTAVNLPLKLAIALLKDRDGRITVDLPISGDLDNPTFHLGTLIRSAVVSMITNIVTAPFEVLASLFGGDADKMSSVPFQPGQFTIGAGKTKHITSLVQALQERPELILEVEATYNMILDSPVLVAQQIEAAIQALNKKTMDGQPITPDSRITLTRELLKTQLAKNSQANTSQPEQPPLNADDIADDKLLSTLKRHWSVNTLDLRQLAIHRARSIKDALIAKGLEAQRVYILDSQEAKPNENSHQKNQVFSQLNLTVE